MAGMGLNKRAMKITMNGLINYPKQKTLLEQIGESLVRCANDKTGHLGDVTSVIRTSMSSLDLLAKSLSEESERQKSITQSNPTT